jgi:hypothetical protein
MYVGDCLQARLVSYKKRPTHLTICADQLCFGEGKNVHNEAIDGGWEVNNDQDKKTNRQGGRSF